MKHVAIGAVFSAFLIAACDFASTRDAAAERQAIAAATAQFEAAENAGSVDQFRSFFADDLVVMGPDKPPVTGGDTVAAQMRVFHEKFAVQVEYNSQEIVLSGDWAFDRGTERYTLTPKAGGAPIHKSGNYLYLYQRQGDGSWKQSESYGISSVPLR